MMVSHVLYSGRIAREYQLIKDKTMQPHQERVMAEKKELDEKLEKLSDFIFKGDLFGTLDSKEQDRLRRQYTFMSGYSDVLRERITAF